MGGLHRAVQWAGVSGLYLIAFFSVQSTAGASIGLLLATVAFFCTPEAWRRCARVPIFWLCLAALLYILWRTTWAVNEFPGDKALIIRQGKNWAFLFLLFPLGWWLSRAPGRINTTLLLVISGFILGIISSLDSELISHIQQGLRSGFHFNKPIIFGYHAAIMILGILMFAPRWLNSSHKQIKPLWFIRVIATVALLVLFVEGLVISNSRGIWLSCILVMPGVLIARYLVATVADRRYRNTWLPGLLIISTISLVLILNWGAITHRISDGSRIFSTIVSEGLDTAELNPTSYRIHMWRFGIKKWLQRPLIGWGPGSTRQQVAESSDPAMRNESGHPWDHLHSGYVELLFQLGMVGGGLALALFWLLIRGLIRAYGEGRLPWDMLIFLLGNFAMIAIYSLTDFRHLQWNWRFYWLLLTGISLVYLMPVMQQRRIESKT